jgi:hypothetical protein
MGHRTVSCKRRGGFEKRADPMTGIFQSTANLDLPMEKPALPTAFDHLS